jgi:hydroxymethylpyrimidine pyrophosphatase-like HAD family hydrolase
MRCLYVDLDGTLLGRGGSLLRDGDGAFTLLGVRALEACARADIEVVIYSGRRKAQVFEDARLIGSTAYIYEVGSALVIDGEEEFLTDGMQPGERSIHDQIADSGAPALLLDRFGDRLEYHTPWDTGRQISHLFRGNLDLEEIAAALAEAGLDGVRLVDNGALHRRASPTLPGVTGLHAYHLVPAGASKARAVARHMQARGYAREECLAVGDSREDIEAAGVVGTFWLVANALVRDPGLREDVAGRPNVRIAEESHGAGVYEAVVTTLAERRG